MWMFKTKNAMRMAMCCCAIALAFQPVRAADLLTVQLDMKDGVLTPSRLEIPAKTRVKITIKNTGSSAVEFESVQLRKEKVLAPGAESFVVLAPLSPGEYKFFDDFHPSAQGVIVVK